MAYDKQADCACYIYCLKEIPRSFDRGVVFRRLFGTLLSSQVTGAHQSQNLFTGCAFGASVVKVQEM